MVTRRVSTESLAPLGDERRASLLRKRKADSIHDVEECKKHRSVELCAKPQPPSADRSSEQNAIDGNTSSILTPSPEIGITAPVLVPFESSEMTNLLVEINHSTTPESTNENENVGLIPKPKSLECLDATVSSVDSQEPVVNGGLRASRRYLAQISELSCQEEEIRNKIPSTRWHLILYALVSGAIVYALAFKAQDVYSQSFSHFISVNASIPPSSPLQPARETVCVPGGGFSGVWSVLGKLEKFQSTRDASSEQEFYCYSAGCLGLAAVLSGVSAEAVLDVALEVQQRWRTGQINRFEAVPEFVDDLIRLIIEEKQRTSDFFSVVSNTSAVGLETLRIITGQRNEGWGVKPVLRTPAVEGDTWVPSLRKLLIQTTWIPFAIGHDLWLDDHVDGIFVASRVWGNCDRIIRADHSWDILWNSLNINMGRDLALSFLKGSH